MTPRRPASVSRRAWLRATCLSAAALPPLRHLSASGQETIIVENVAGAAIPVSLSGYSGEALDTLRFDLEVAGCRLVGESDAQYTLAGGSSGGLEGRLATKAGSSLFGKVYTKGTVRQQAHALADDVIKALGGQGVARTRIAFKCEPEPGRSEIYVADYDGHGATAVTTDNSIVAAPAWVPGKFAVLYTSYRLGNPDIFVHDLGNGSRRPFSRRAGLNTSAALSPDGTRVAMILSKDGSPNLYVGRLDGGEVTRLTNNRQGDSSPCWSPDGQTVCYSTRANGPSTLFTVPASGGTPRRLRLAGVANATEPDWSPDGKHIVFTTQGGGSFEVCTVPAAGGEVIRLGPGEDPVWGPNSRTILLARRVGGGRRVLSLLDAPTRQKKDLPRLSGSCSQPTWAR